MTHTMQFERTIQLIGEEPFRQLQAARVLLVGVGGVGGWCAEALVRTGIGHLTLIDMDTVAESNLNRQLVATRSNIGRNKVEEMRSRLLCICPEADIQAIAAKYDTDGMLDDGTARTPIDLTRFDYIVDAIDMPDCKMRLIHDATHAADTDGDFPILFSSMGAGRKTDTAPIRVTEFWKVEGCPLARALRTKMRKSGLLPGRKFLCVSSPEISGTSGTVAPVVGIFGFTLANLVIRAITGLD